MAIINKEVLVKFGVKFAIGADILKLGNRQFEKELGSDEMSGDSVYFCVSDGGVVQNNGSLQLNSGNHLPDATTARRTKKKALTLKPIVCWNTIKQTDLDLLITKGEFGSKMTARAIEAIEDEAYTMLKGVASAECADDATGIIDAFMNAHAYLEASKVEGEVCGAASVWNDKSISSAYAKVGISNGGSVFSASQQKGLDASTGFMGFKWGKMTAGQNKLISAWNYGTSNYVTAMTGKVDGGSYIIETVTLNAKAVATNGDRIDSPFTIQGITLCDELGEDTNIPMTFTGITDSATGKVVTLDRPIVVAHKDGGNIIDPLANACVSSNYGFSKSGSTLTISINTASASASQVLGVLTYGSGNKYYQPVLLWKKDEFLVAVKGLQPMKGVDSDTIPANFGGDKGIIPWRGTAWAQEESSTHCVRFDSYFGFGYFKGIAVRAIYIKAN